MIFISQSTVVFVVLLAASPCFEANPLAHAQDALKHVGDTVKHVGAQVGEQFNKGVDQVTQKIQPITQQFQPMVKNAMQHVNGFFGHPQPPQFQQGFQGFQGFPQQGFQQFHQQFQFPQQGFQSGPMFGNRFPMLGGMPGVPQNMPFNNQPSVLTDPNAHNQPQTDGTNPITTDGCPNGVCSINNTTQPQTFPPVDGQCPSGFSLVNGMCEENKSTNVVNNCPSGFELFAGECKPNQPFSGVPQDVNVAAFSQQPQMNQMGYPLTQQPEACDKDGKCTGEKTCIQGNICVANPPQQQLSGFGGVPQFQQGQFSQFQPNNGFGTGFNPGQFPQYQQMNMGPQMGSPPTMNQMPQQPVQ